MYIDRNDITKINNAYLVFCLMINDLVIHGIHRVFEFMF